MGFLSGFSRRRKADSAAAKKQDLEGYSWRSRNAFV
jgi:hypothetical protein